MIDKNKWFYFAAGRSAKDLPELVEALRKISNEEFVFHVNAGKNDFANWVEGVFGHEDLASDLRRVLERKDTIEMLERFIHRKEERQSIDEAIEKKIEKHDIEKSREPAVAEAVPKPPELPGHPMPEEIESVRESMDRYNSEVAESVAASSALDHEAPELKLKSEHELNEGDIKEIVSEAKEELEVEGRQIESRKRSGEFMKDEGLRMIVKEFIFGFIIGLVFGLIMLGAILNLKVCPT